MNKANVLALCHKVERKTGLSFNTVLLYYFLESILKRLTDGENKDSFIFKGGFLLSNVIGIQTRTTVDIDFLLHHREMSEESIRQLFKETLEPKEGDISYTLQRLEPIREEDPYGGYRAHILCKLENIRQMVPLDIAVGDVITPHPVTYDYVSIFDEERIPIKAYSLETMIAEKLQTIYERAFLNSRSKDFYDLYILYHVQQQHLDAKMMREACIRTFSNRKTEFNSKKLYSLLMQIKGDPSFLTRWSAYAKKNRYIGDLSFAEVIEGALKLLDLMEEHKDESAEE